MSGPLHFCLWSILLLEVLDGRADVVRVADISDPVTFDPPRKRFEMNPKSSEVNCSCLDAPQYS
jgi:hypothetical protein